MQSVSIIGVGRAGGALALALAEKGYPIDALVYRSAETAEMIAARISPRPGLFSSASLPEIRSDVIFITTADPEIQPISMQLECVVQSKPCVFHVSGSLSSELLSNLREIGCRTGSIHPLVSISDPVLGAAKFSGAYFCVEGDYDAVVVGKDIVKSLGGIPFTIQTELKALYHASAVTACGHVTALIDVAIEMLSKCGLEPDESRRVLLPLIRSTVENLEGQNTAAALTGSFARADLAAFERHLTALQTNVSDQAQQIYLQLGERSLLLAERRGVEAGEIQKIRDRISIAKRNLK